MFVVFLTHIKEIAFVIKEIIIIAKKIVILKELQEDVMKILNVYCFMDILEIIYVEVHNIIVIKNVIIFQRLQIKRNAKEFVVFLIII